MNANKTLYILGALLIAGFGVLGAMEMMNAQTPYVQTLAEVRSKGDRPVQLVGSLVPGKARYDDDHDELLFQLRDDAGEQVAVRYKGVKPANFDTADRAVVRGKYTGKEFIADKLLLKCPSKYQGK